MRNKPILIVAGDPYSVFIEIFLKSIKRNKYKSPLILICNKENFVFQLKKFGINKKIRVLDYKNLNKTIINNNKINIIDVELSNLNNKSNSIFIEKCFQIGIKLIKQKYTYKFINGPINKKIFLKNKFLGITEYISSKFKEKKFGMLIYNKKLSVCPLTTHLPLKQVSKHIKIKSISEKIVIIDKFFKKYLKVRAKIAVTGVNPHCESVHKFNEDKKIVLPAIKLCKKKNIDVKGPYPADTIFLKKNRDKFNIILGMYHDQVLTPIKTLFEYNAINVTMGLSFLRVTPDHGPNQKMYGKNKSNPQSLIEALNFLDNK